MHLPNIAFSAILNTFEALTFEYVLVAREQYSNPFYYKCVIVVLKLLLEHV
jgi:hypothetical protein